MTEDELVRRVCERSRNPRLATSAGGWGCGWENLAETFPPAPESVVQEALVRFGFPLPRLLVRLWSEVANGGIGPGYGIFGLEGGLTDDGLDLPLPDLYLMYRDEPYWIELIGAHSASKTFPICDWGCCTGSAMDCTLPQGNMILLADGVRRIDQEVSFAQWIEDWLEGIKVGASDYRGAKDQ